MGRRFKALLELEITGENEEMSEDEVHDLIKDQIDEQTDDLLVINISNFVELT